MGLKIIRDNGTPRRTWYGQYFEGGRYKVKNLGVPVRGTIPDNLSAQGDEAFEKSRVKAQAAFDAFQAERKSKGTADHLTETLIESKTGQKVEYVRLDELYPRWLGLQRSYTPTESRMTVTKSIFQRFAKATRCTYLYEVSPADVADFFNHLREELAWATVKDYMSTLKTMFDRFLPAGSTNPFSGIIKRNREAEAAKVHRKPLTNEELAKLIEAAQYDDLLRPLTICAACTGLRIGDVCLLKWTDIDLANDIIELNTSKTGVRVTIPILPLLRKEIDSALAHKEDGEIYVFPDAATMYRHNKTGIIKRGKALFANALFKDAKTDTIATLVNADGEPAKPPTDEEVYDLIANSLFASSKRQRMLDTFKRYRSGQKYREIEAETGRSRGQISQDLHAVEALAGTRYLSGPERQAKSTRSLQMTRQTRTVGKNAASLYGWHSLRATFVVQALQAGIDLETVKRIVGHTTAKMTLEYYNPTKKHTLDKMFKGKNANTLITSKPDMASLAATLKTMTDEDRRNLLALIKS